MSSPDPAGRPLPGTVYTFYSYKGGVGRSMALANVGVLLATQGFRVLLVDWDLEAPGLEMYFLKSARLDGDRTEVPGVVDLLEGRIGKQQIDWRRCLLGAQFAGHRLDIITAGMKTEDYRRRVQRLDWEALFTEHDVGNFVDELRAEWRAAYDFVLIDSRTGITDIGDICTVLLPDALVFLFVTNHQNVDGVKMVMERAVRARARLPIHRSKLIGVPVPARDERDRESAKFDEWHRIFADQFGDMFREWLPKDVKPEEALLKVFIPYIASWSFGESLPVLESARERSDPSSLGAAYSRLASLLAARLDWAAIDALASASELVSSRLEAAKAREEAERAEKARAELESALANATKRLNDKQDMRAIVVAPQDLLLAGDAAPIDDAAFAHRFIAQGDSWFWPAGPRSWAHADLTAFLQMPGPTFVVNCSRPGRGLTLMTDALADPVFLDLISGSNARRWDAILLSGGCHDIVAAMSVLSSRETDSLLLSRFSRHRSRPAPGRYMSMPAWQILAEHLSAVLDAFLNRRDTGINRGAPVFLHTYDFPTPRYAPADSGVGPWLKPIFDMHAIPWQDQDALANEAFESLAATLAQIVQRHARRNVHLIDTLGTLTRAPAQHEEPQSDWENELHPNARGYAKLAPIWRAKLELSESRVAETASPFLASLFSPILPGWTFDVSPSTSASTSPSGISFVPKSR